MLLIYIAFFLLIAAIFIAIYKHFKVYTLFILLIICNSAYSQKVITMEKVNGVYRISCSVNGAKMKMVFDTGASAVSISESMANYLYDNDYITSNDILGSTKTQTADGSIHDNVVINIKDIEISGLHLKNVQALVSSSQNAPLLLGQTAIQKLGRISLNGNKLIIYDYEGDYSNEELDLLIEKAQQSYNDGYYYQTIDYLQKFLDYGELTTYGYYMLINSLMKTKRYDEAIKYGKEWEIRNKDDKKTYYTTMILAAIATSYDIKEDYRNSILYQEKSISVDIQLGNNPCIAYAQIALTYYAIKDYNASIDYSKKAFIGMLKEYNISEEEIRAQGCNNSNLGMVLYYYAKALYGKYDYTRGNYIMSLSAKCNYHKAIEYCYIYSINY